MTHTITIDNFESFTPIVLMAAGDGKRLDMMVFPLTESINFIVRKQKKIVYIGSTLEDALDVYNEG